MTREEAIRHLANKIGYYKSFGEISADAVSVEALELAVRALKKQEPMKVNNHLCPDCGKDVIGSGYYCWNCGQHLRWEVEEQ